MNVAVLFSGGKDSTYALYLALNEGLNVKTLLSINPLRDDSYMFHKPCIELASLQADCIGIPIIEETVSGVKEKEVKELERVLACLDVEGIVSGAVESQYQKTRIEKVCANLGLKSFSPLWQKNPSTLLTDILSDGFEVMVVGVAAQGLDDAWLGRIISSQDIKLLEDLEKKFGVHICGEGGEYETFVVDGPIFTKKIRVEDSEKKWDGQRGSLIIIETELEDKT